MNYTEEKIYAEVGRDDRTVTVNFRKDSDAYEQYGPSITGVFMYDQFQREDLDKRLADPDNQTNGKVKIKYLGSDLTEGKVSMLEMEGVLTSDIVSLFHFNWPGRNTFHSTDTREVTVHTIPMKMQPKGRDYNWMYGAAKRMVKEGIGMGPKDREFYLGCKLYFEPDAFSEEEQKEINDETGKLKFEVEWNFLGIKLQREEASEDEVKKLGLMIRVRQKEAFSLLEKNLKQAGTTVAKLMKENEETAIRLFTKTERYQERNFNVTGKFPVYLDADRFLHIYLRHVKEGRVSERFDWKDNFQWKEEDIFIPMESVLELIMDDIQEHFEKRPGRRYRRTGRKNIYFEGDYYSLWIEADGKISTFYKNRKAHEKEPLSNAGNTHA